MYNIRRQVSVAPMSRILNRIANPLKPHGNIVWILLCDQQKLNYEQIFTFKLVDAAARRTGYEPVGRQH